MKIKKVISHICYLAFLLLLSYALYIEFKPNMLMGISGRVFVGLVSVFLLLLASGLRISGLKSEKAKRQTMKITVSILFALYVFYLVILLFFDRSFGRGFFDMDYSHFNLYLERKTNFIPFKTILHYAQELIKGGSLYPVINLMGNIFAFFPMGLFVPAMFPSINKAGRFFMFIFGCLVFTELAQLLLMTGSCDIDDILLNALGAMAGWLLLKAKPIQYLARRLYIIK